MPYIDVHPNIEAIEYNDGSIRYSYNEFFYHRVDGPAIIFADGRVEWWLDNVNYSFDKWCKLVDISDETKVMMKLEYG
jgi:hypothetical protein